MQAIEALEKEVPTFLPFLTNPEENPKVRSIIAHILAYFPALDSTLKTTDILVDFFHTLIALPCPSGTTTTGSPPPPTQFFLFCPKKVAMKMRRMTKMRKTRPSPNWTGMHNDLKRRYYSQTSSSPSLFCIKELISSKDTTSSARQSSTSLSRVPLTHSSPGGRPTRCGSLCSSRWVNYHSQRRYSQKCVQHPHRVYNKAQYETS